MERPDRFGNEATRVGTAIVEGVDHGDQPHHVYCAIDEITKQHATTSVPSLFSPGNTLAEQAVEYLKAKRHFDRVIAYNFAIDRLWPPGYRTQYLASQSSHLGFGIAETRLDLFHNNFLVRQECLEDQLLVSVSFCACSGTFNE